MKTKPRQKSKSKALPVFLRALEESDIERTHRWHGDARLYDMLCASFHPVSRATETEWLRRKAAYSNTEINLAICLKPAGEHIGNIYLRDIDWIARKAELHVFIGGSEHRGLGYGQTAVRQMLHHAFVDLNLKRVFLTVLADNVAAVKTYEKCGFELEGRLINHVFKLGQYKDVLVMGIRSDKFKQLKEEK